MTAYSSCWACYALSDEDMSNLPGSCKHCGREFTKPVTAPVEPAQVLCGPDGQWSITGLSENDLWALWGILMAEIGRSELNVSREIHLSKIIIEGLDPAPRSM